MDREVVVAVMVGLILFVWPWIDLCIRLLLWKSHLPLRPLALDVRLLQPLAAGSTHPPFLPASRRWTTHSPGSTENPSLMFDGLAHSLDRRRCCAGAVAKQETTR